MKKWIIRISIVVLLLIIIASIVFNSITYFQNKKYKRIIEINDDTIKNSQQYIINLNKQIKEFADKPPITITEFIKLPDKEKDTAYSELLNNYNKAINIIKDNKEEILKITDQLKESNDLNKKLIKNINNSGLHLYVMGGFGNLNETFAQNDYTKLNINLTLGVDYIKYMINNRLGFCIGGYIKPIQDLEIGANLGLIINLPKIK